MPVWQTGNLDEAAVWFRTLKAVSPKYREEAIYQLGYIDYTEKRYGSALDAFVSLQSDPNYAEIVPYYIGDIYLIQQAYDKAQNIAAQYLKQLHNIRMHLKCNVFMDRLVLEKEITRQQYNRWKSIGWLLTSLKEKLFISWV